MKLLSILLLMTSLTLPVHAGIVIVCDENGNCNPMVIFKRDIHD